MKLKFIVSAYNHQIFPFVDYDYKATERSKRRLYKEICNAGVLQYFLDNRPDIIKDMTKL